MKQFIFSLFFVLGACNTLHQVSSPLVVSSSELTVVNSENLLIKLEEGITIKQVLDSFSDYHMTLVNTVVESLNLYLVAYNDKMIAQDEMIKKLKASTMVKGVEVDKSLELRE